LKALLFSAGVHAGWSKSYRIYALDYNHNFLYSGAHMSTKEHGPTTAYVFDANFSMGFGYFDSTDPFANPFKKITDQTTGDFGISYGFFSVGEGGSVPGEKEPFSYSTVGVGYGFGMKNLKKASSEVFGTVLTNHMPGMSITAHTEVVYMSVPSLDDSVRTAVNNRGNATAESVLRRNPVKGKCLTCK
jgi:hypothetical protein